eukprot:3158111-Pleurochrysis_carterae.AAC.1
MIIRVNAAAHAANKENSAAVTELEAQVQRLNEGRIWARVREKQKKRIVQAQEARRVLQEQFDQ